MDINDNQQVNTFLKGMNTDVSDMMLDPQLYRYAENLRLITDTESNSGELRLIEGTEKLYEFEGWEVIYLGSIRDYVVAILWDESGECWKIVATKHSKQTMWGTIFGPCNSKIWVGSSRPHISAVLNYESDDNIKLYFVDDTKKHGIMSINIYKELLHLSPRTDLDYLLSFTRNGLPKPETLILESHGNLLPSKVQYVYRLYKDKGGSSILSPVSDLVSLYKDSKTGSNVGEITGRSVRINIQLENVYEFSKILIYRISYQEIGQEPTVHLIYDKKFNYNSISIVDLGNNVYLISSEELKSLDGIQISPSIIESKNNYLFAANLEYNLDSVDKKFKNIDTRAISSGNFLDDGNVTPVQLDLNNNIINPNNYQILHKLFYYDDLTYNENYWLCPDTEEIGGKGPYVEWKLVKREIILNLLDEYDIDKLFNAFKHDETYRFGIRLYDDYGNPSSVKWIADIRIPPFDPLLDIQPQIFIGKYKYRIYDILFTVKSIPNCSSYEIVRCIRDRVDSRILFLGIVGHPTRSTIYKYTQSPFDSTVNIETLVGKSDYMFNPGFFTLLEFHANNRRNNSGENVRDVNVYSGSLRDYLMFACPEVCYKPDAVKDILQVYSGSNMQFKNVAEYAVVTETPDESHPIWNDPLEKENYIRTAYSTSEINAPLFKKYSNITNNINYTQILYDCRTMNVTYYLSHWRQNHTDMGNPLEMSVTFNLFVPIEACSYNISSLNTQNKILNNAIVLSPGYEDYADEEKNITFLDNVNVIGSLQFVNWSTIFYTDFKSEAFSELIDFDERHTIGESPEDTDLSLSWYPIGKGGNLILFELNNAILQTATEDVYLPVRVANLVKDCIPYGGYSDAAITNSVYYSFGDYSNLFDRAVTISSGDCYVGLFRYNAATLWDHPTLRYCNRMSSVYIVPVESDIDLRGDCGITFNLNLNKGYAIQYEPVDAKVYLYIQNKSSYIYNSAYSIQPTLFLNYINSEEKGGNFDTRIHYSELKTNNEDIDNWLKFKPINYIDVETDKGLITQIDNFKDRLLFWLESGFGVISSNERQLVLNSEGNDLMLGTGSVLLRYDYLSTIYGMKYGQFANVQSDNSEYWWDEQNREILLYTSQSIPSPISTTKGVKLYLKSEVTDVPHLMYDNKYKEVIFHLLNNECISYSEQLLAFTSIYTLKILYDTVVGNRLIVTNGSRIDLWNSSGNSSELFGTEAHPMILFVINKNNTMVKTFDIQTFGGRFYGGNTQEGDLDSINIKYKTPLKQFAEVSGNNITDREYDFRLDIPRERYTENGVVKTSEYGGRLRGKTMLCELSSSSNSTDFSLQYIITKYRISWS